MSSSQSSGRGLRVSRRSMLPARDLMGASELFISWPSTRIRRCQAWRSSSRSARLTSDSTRRRLGQSALAEAAAPRLEASHPSGQAHLEHPGLVGGDPVFEAQLAGGAAEELLRGSAQEALAGAVGQAQAMLAVEGEHGDVDLLHHLAQQRGGLERSQPLRAQGVGEGVDLEHRLAEGVVRTWAARAEAEVLLAERRQEVRERLQGAHHGVLDRESEAHPEEDHEQAQRPLRPGRVVAGEEQDEGEQAPGQARAAGPGRSTRRSWLRGLRARRRSATIHSPRVARARSAAGGGRGRCATARGRPRRG